MSCIQQNFPSKFEPNDAFYEKLEQNTFVAFILRHPVVELGLRKMDVAVSMFNNSQFKVGWRIIANLVDYNSPLWHQFKFVILPSSVAVASPAAVSVELRLDLLSLSVTPTHHINPTRIRISIQKTNCQNPNLTTTQHNLNLIGFVKIIAVHTTPPPPPPTRNSTKIFLTQKCFVYPISFETNKFFHQKFFFSIINPAPKLFWPNICLTIFFFFWQIYF